MPNKSKTKNKAAAESPEQKSASIQQTGKDLLAKLQEQVDNLTRLADDYLDQGLLGHYEEALQMREGAKKTLEEMSAKLKMKPPSSKPSPATVVPTPESPASAVSVPDAATTTLDIGSALLAEGWSMPVGDSKDMIFPLLPRYRWLSGQNGSGAMLEIMSPSSSSSNGVESDSESFEKPEVDIAERLVKCHWLGSGWTLTLSAGFCIHSQFSRLIRKRRIGLLQLNMVPSSPASLEGHTEQLTKGLCSKDGCSWSDGFLCDSETDKVRARLLELWRAGQFEPGEVEGGKKARVRSDVYMYVEEGDPVISIFTRRLDRLVLAMAKEVPELRGLWLMRGRPMAAIYAGAGSKYTPHYDAVGGDNGRKITCILYLNPFWKKGDGAELHIWPQAKHLQPSGTCHEVDPLHGRLACFLCDSRNLHAVNPVTSDGLEPRMAISCWYYDSQGGMFDRQDENDCNRPQDRPVNANALQQD